MTAEWMWKLCLILKNALSLNKLETRFLEFIQSGWEKKTNPVHRVSNTKCFIEPEMFPLWTAAGQDGPSTVWILCWKNRDWWMWSSYCYLSHLLQALGSQRPANTIQHTIVVFTTFLLTHISIGKGLELRICSFLFPPQSIL